MALCHSLMFFVVVAINLTPGVQKREYVLSVNGQPREHDSTVTLWAGENITVVCKFAGDGPAPIFTRVDHCNLENKSYNKSAVSATMKGLVTHSHDRCSCYGHYENKTWLDPTHVKLVVITGPRTQSTASPVRTKEPVTTRPIADNKTTTESTPRATTHSKTSPRPIKKTNQGTTNEQNGPGSEPKTTRPTAATKIRKASTSPNNKLSYTSGKPTQKNNQLDVKKQDQVSSELTTTGPTGERSGRDLKTASNSREANSVQDENNMDLLVIIVPASICVVLALIVTLVIVVLVLRRKTATRNIQDKGEPTYAVVQDVETKRDYIGTNIDETYAVVNKKQKANKKDVGPQDFNPLDETYAAVNKSKKTNRGDTEVSTDPVSNPMAQPKGMNFNMAALREEADGLAVYKKQIQKEHDDSSTEDKTKTNSTEGSGRYLNEDGLVYVTIELNPVAPKSTIKPPSIVRDERYEPVEYSTVVFGQGAKKDETNDEG